MPRYEGDWVAGLREGKGKYLSKPTGEMSRWQQPLRWLHDRQIQIQGANTRESMWRTWRRGQANTRLPTGTLTTASGRRDWDMDRGRTLGRRRTKSRTHSLKQWPSSHVFPFPFSSFSSTHSLWILSLYQGDCHQQYVNLSSCQLSWKALSSVDHILHNTNSHVLGIVHKWNSSVRCNVDFMKASLENQNEW